MIKEITGDLVESAGDYDVIVHGANCQCTMGSGIAKSIRAQFPEAYEIDQKTVKGDRGKLGTISCTVTTSPIVVNAYTQFNYLPRNVVNVDYDAVRSCMKEIKKRFTGKKIGLPKIGAGLAGGDWTIIKQIIEEELSDEDVTIVIWNGN